MKEYPKKIRWQLRELANLACEKELGVELEALAAKFEDWKAGRISADDLCDLIHKFHQGPARKIYERYSVPSQAGVVVPAAVAAGVLTREDVPDETWGWIEETVEIFRRLNS